MYNKGIENRKEVKNMPEEQNRFFCNILNSEKNDYLNLLQVGWDKCTPNYTYSNYRDMYIIHYVKSGFGTIECENEAHTVGAGDSFIFRPNVLTVHSASSTDPYEFYFFAFDGKLAKKLIERTVFRNGKVAVSAPSDNLCWLIKEAAENLSVSSQTQFKKLEYLFKLISHYDISNVTDILQNASPREIHREIVYNVKKYIQFNFSNSIKISDISAQLNINRSHLYRIFKQDTGKSIEEYLVSIRMNEARRLLQETDLSAKRISEIVGYLHYSSFFNAFEHYCGTTPQQYRKDLNLKKQASDTAQRF